MLQQSEIIRNDRGAELCHRVKKVAVENIQGDPSKGYHYIDAYCNTPVLFDIEEKGKTCPSCEKRPPIGNVHPRVTNAAGVKLTQKELSECGLTEDTSLIPQKQVAEKKVRAKKAVEAKVNKVKKDIVVIEVDLVALDQAADIAAVLIRKASDALDKLPVTDFGESKRLIKLQEKLESLLRV